MERLEVSADLVAVIRRMVVIWIDAESGAPAVAGLQNGDGSISWFEEGAPPGLPLATYRSALQSEFARVHADRARMSPRLDADRHVLPLQRKLVDPSPSVLTSYFSNE